MSGILNLVSVGPGFTELITPMAERALKESDTVVGYAPYLPWVEPWIAGKAIYTTELTRERERAHTAIQLARAGHKVALVSGGDIGVYAMAALAFEEMDENDAFEVRVIPGVTAANACASLLGAPLAHDYVALSLSDRLCPWEWIEERARAIAQADLAVALYNVQSATRQEGIYRVLTIMLDYKAPKTLCGTVRNAYRPDQAMRVCTLGELVSQRFDMFTTVLIGNRYTRCKRGWIYTPRGYGGWQPVTAERPEPPRGAVWVFSGTSDGNALAREIAARGHRVVVSAATEYGRETALRSCPGVHVLMGRRGSEARRQDLARSATKIIVDATHPYACAMSRQLIELSQALEIPYLRFERPSALAGPGVHSSDSVEEAARRAVAIGKRTFLATGSKDLATFLEQKGAGDRAWFVRVAPDPHSVRKTIELGLPRAHICAMQGPFSAAFNELLWREWRIDCVVTKESGDPGGYNAKAAAATVLGIPMVVIRRPYMEYPTIAADFDSVFRYIREMCLHD